MALPPSGQISINQIRTELGTANGSLRSLSSLAGFSTPDAMSEFYGYSAAITVNWSASLFCPTASYSITKNGSTISSGGGDLDDGGTFTCVVGDVLVASQTSGIKGSFCSGAQSAIDRNFVTVVYTSVPGFNVTATSTWTVTSGTTSVQMYAGAIA
jgi:hypothetical protein